MSMGLYHLSDEIETKLYRFFKDTSRKWMLKPGVKTLLEQLKEREINIGLISNFSNNLNKLINLLNLSYYIKYSLVSQDAGLEKPNILFYELFLSKSSFNKNESFYVGDNYILDYLPATTLGLSSYLLDEDDFFFPQDITIKSISDVMMLVNKFK